MVPDSAVAEHFATRTWHNPDFPAHPFSCPQPVPGAKLKLRLQAVHVSCNPGSKFLSDLVHHTTPQENLEHVKNDMHAKKL
jgi:hypothetical protein